MQKGLGWVTRAGVIALAVGAGMSISAWAQNKPQLGYKDTPLLPGGKWHVHDGDRPQPKIVTPGTNSTQDTPGKAPSDATVLFDGTSLDKWQDARGNPSRWKVENGAMVVTAGGGPIFTRESFGDCQLHVEWAAPNPAKGSGQGRGNSGLFFFETNYEVQILDSFENQTYPDGQAGALYGQRPPLVNASRRPGEWQSYDVIFEAPRFDGDKLAKPGFITVLHNGVVLHHRQEILGRMLHRQLPSYAPHGPRGKLSFQDHGDPVKFRNIWIRELKDYDQP